MSRHASGIGPPVILLGTHRSGTTWLGEVFSHHPRLAYWVEPRHVWTWGNSYRPDDALDASHATPKVRAHIRKAFDDFVRREGRERLCEKTPSNCLRLSFIRAVVPEARLILIIRDGRSVVRSAAEIMRGGVPMRRIVTRAFQTPIWEWPAYARQAAGTLGRKVTRKPLDFWGPRPPGWRDWVGRDHPDVVRAKQWAGTISACLRDARALSDADLLRFRYEDLMRDPRAVMGRVLEFCGLDDAGVIERAATTADPARVDKWRDELDDETLARVRPHLEPVLNELGYGW